MKTIESTQAATSIAAAAAETSGRKEALGIAKRSSRFFIDPKMVVIDPEWNVRFDLGDIEGLAASIKAQKERDPESGGLIQEIGVKRIPATHPLAQGGKKCFMVRWGHRRTTAIDLLMNRGEEFPLGIPAKIVDKGQDTQAAMLEMFIENTNKPMTPIEEAYAYKRLRDGIADEGIKGMTIKEICKAVGRAVPHVTAMLDLLSADASVIEGLKKGEINKMDAKNIAQVAKGDSETQKKLVDDAKKAAKGDKNARVALDKGLHSKKAAKAAKKGRTIKMRALSDAELADLGKKVAERMAKLLKDAGKPLDFDLRDWVGKDDKLALAASFGALQALKAAAGLEKDIDGAFISLEF